MSDFVVPKDNIFHETIEDYAVKMDSHDMLTGVARDCRALNKVPPKSKKDRFQEATDEVFELIGGVPRLAMWAEANQTEFYKMKAKQSAIHQQQINNFNAPTQIVIHPAIQRSALDGPDEPIEGEATPNEGR